MTDYKWPKITADTPIEEVQDIHKRIWDYTIQHGAKPVTGYMYECAACEYVYVKNKDVRNKCEFCPIKWPDGLKCYQVGSLFWEWGDAGDRKFAKQIRDVKFKKRPTYGISYLKAAIKSLKRKKG